MVQKLFTIFPRMTAALKAVVALVAVLGLLAGQGAASASPIFTAAETTFLQQLNTAGIGSATNNRALIDEGWSVIYDMQHDPTLNGDIVATRMYQKSRASGGYAGITMYQAKLIVLRALGDLLGTVPSAGSRFEGAISPNDL